MSQPGCGSRDVSAGAPQPRQGPVWRIRWWAGDAGAGRRSGREEGDRRATVPFIVGCPEGLRQPLPYNHFLKRKKRMVSAEQSTMSPSAKR